MPEQWWKKPLRFLRIEFSCDQSRILNWDLEEMARLITERYHCNVDMPQATPALPPADDLENGMSTITFALDGYRRYSGMENWDWLRTWIPIAHKHGIRVVPYANLHWFTNAFALEHPEWQQRLADGRPYGEVYPLYGEGFTMCVNTGWRDWAINLISGVAQTGADGIFLDGPVIFPDCCYCATCRERFHIKYGNVLPDIIDHNTPIWHNFVEFREDSLANFIDDARNAFRKINPESVVFCNSGAFLPGAWRVARDIEKLQTVQDINAAEAFYHPGANIPMHFSSLVGKYERAGDVPGLVFLHHLNGPYHYMGLNPEEIGLAAAQAMASGCAVNIVTMADAIDNAPKENIAGAAPLIMQAKHEELWDKAESYAEIALLASGRTLRYYCSDLETIYQESGSAREQNLVADLSEIQQKHWEERKNVCDKLVTLAYDGWYYLLTRNHFQFDVLLDSKISASNLCKYRVLILPNTACLSDTQIDAIEEFINNGGAVIASFESGRYDENGWLRKDWHLGKLLGLQSFNDALPVYKTEEFTDLKSTGAFRQDIEGRRLPRAYYAGLVTSSLAPIATYYEIVGRLYKPLSAVSNMPSIIAQDDKRSVYFAEEIGHFYSLLKMPWTENIMRNAVQYALNGQSIVRKANAKVVQVEVWKQPGRLLVHLVNNSGDMQRPITERYPVRDLRIGISSSMPKRVWQASDDRTLTFSWDSGTTEFILPVLDLYEVVVIEIDE